VRCTAIPLLGGLLDGVVDVAALGLCVPPIDAGGAAALTTTRPRRAVGCQRTIAMSAATFLRRRIATMRGCVDALFRCAITSSDDCSKRAARCADRLGRARVDGFRILAGQIRRACATLGVAEILGDDGVGFASAGSQCADLGVEAIRDLDDVASCVARAASCAGERALGAALPRMEDAGGPVEPSCTSAAER
jgi:hypothetical protein